MSRLSRISAKNQLCAALFLEGARGHFNQQFAAVTAQNTDQSDAVRFLHFLAKLKVKRADQDHFDESLIQR